MGVKVLIILSLVSTLMLTGCTNSTFNKSMEEGKLALASKEYEKANGLFSLALEEKENSKEAKELKESTEKLVEINKLNSEGNLVDAIKLCDELKGLNIESEIILKEVDRKRNELQEKLDKVNDENKDIEEKITKAESLISNKQYEDARKLLNELGIEIKENNNADDLLDRINTLIEECDEKIAISESKKNITSQKAKEILYQKVSIDLDYELLDDLDSDSHIYGESINNFYCFSPSQNGMPLEGEYCVHKVTGKVYEVTSDGSINEI